ncbi:hypothetical protein KSP39_PZI018943 [Platanthera zijinensis]|uniref:VQ domain-containing protein n=1 Tax=Platanthera zijinensis TaxID=2320716 RepID=A0AAP0FZ18_9ASPA
MDHNSRNHHQHHLGINKHGKSIRKSPIHQPAFPKLSEAGQHQPPPPPQPQVYNISKSDFRSVVQQLTGSPARDPPGARNQMPAPARPPQPKPSSSRLMKNRPPPLTPIFRPPPPPIQNSLTNSNPNPNPNPVFRSGPSVTAPSCATWADSPVSAYMRYLETSLLSLDGTKKQPTLGLLPVPAPFPSPRGHALPSMMTTAHTQPGLLPSPGSQFSLLSPGWQFQLPSPSTQFPLPSPNSQLPLASPSSFLNLMSPKSPSPLLSPGFHYPPSFTPNFSFSPKPQSGILGPGPAAHPPPSPNLLFPPSPSGFLPLLSPRWREM